jgi:hypothetical protein
LKCKPKAELLLLPDAKLMPRVLLHMLLERINEIDNLIVVWTDKDRYPHVQNTRMSMSDITWCAAQLDDFAYEVRSGLLPSGVTTQPKPTKPAA